MEANGVEATAPILSTPAEHIFEESTSAVAPESRLSEEQLFTQYEIKRTITEIRDGRRKRIALQFPDDMLVDAPRVYERLRYGLKQERKEVRRSASPTLNRDGIEELSNRSEESNVEQDSGRSTLDEPQEEEEERLCILGDTSYGACCVDEIAAEHVDADVVVHYGRTCLSPTARLPVIYVFTTRFVDLEAVITSFTQTYPKTEKVCLMADIAYSHHLEDLYTRLKDDGYEDVFATEVVREPSALIPNRTIPLEARDDAEKLQEYSIFHISDPPTSLLLILSSRVKRIHIFPTSKATPQTLEASTSQQLRRRYALLTRLSTASIFGILINTLSVSNYMGALQHCQDLISNAGKKSYVFVVGKVNAAKMANFAEIGGWVVIGCWESSLVESKDFFRPIITPFELEVALKGDAERLWDGQWIGDFGSLLGKEVNGVKVNGGVELNSTGDGGVNGTVDGADWDDQSSDDEPPEYDLRTGKYVTRSRPMGRTKPKPAVSAVTDATTEPSTSPNNAPPSSALVQRAKGDVATMNGAVSPAAEFLRSKRTWQGLGSDYEISYERDIDGRIMGAAIEEGRGGVAKGYSVGSDEAKG